MTDPLGLPRASLPEPMLSSPPTKPEGVRWFLWTMANGTFDRGTTVKAFAAEHELNTSTVRNWSAEASGMRLLGSQEAVEAVRAETVLSLRQVYAMALERAEDANDRDCAALLKTAIDAIDKSADVMGAKPPQSVGTTINFVDARTGQYKPEAMRLFTDVAERTEGNVMRLIASLRGARTEMAELADDEWEEQALKVYAALVVESGPRVLDVVDAKEDG